jgi:hypothetical protein
MKLLPNAGGLRAALPDGLYTPEVRCMQTCANLSPINALFTKNLTLYQTCGVLTMIMEITPTPNNIKAGSITLHHWCADSAFDVSRILHLLTNGLAARAQFLSLL